MVSASRRGIALGAAALILAAPGLFSPGAVGQPTNRAAVVVQHGNPIQGGAECVPFTESQIDGFDLVDRSGFEYLAAQFSFGRAICWLDGEGCESTDPDECFCDPVRSWSLWVQDSGEQLPAPSDTGADDAAVEDGTVHYWVWGPFGEPPVQPTSVNDVCPAETATPASPEPASQQPTDGGRGSSASASTVEAGQVPLPATR